MDAHLTNFIADLKLRQADPLAIAPTSTTPSQATILQHSRLAALTLPLTVPASPSEHDSRALATLSDITTPDALQESSVGTQFVERMHVAVPKGVWGELVVAIPYLVQRDQGLEIRFLCSKELPFCLGCRETRRTAIATLRLTL